MPKNKLPTKPPEQPSLSITEFIARNGENDVDGLSTDAQTLFGLLTLIVDIKYRLKYGSSLGEQTNKRYSENTMKKVVADQITPVDNGLLRH
jgi:hypothetical protein